MRPGAGAAHRAGLSAAQAIEAVRDGLAEGMEASAQRGNDIIVRQLVTAMRHLEPTRDIADLALRYRHEGVAGFDIAGAEKGFPPARFLESISHLRRNNAYYTIHAGEADGLASIEEAVQVCGANRIGHGVAIVEDIKRNESGAPQLGDFAAYVRNERICLEMCPSSNVQTGAAASIAEHPIAHLADLDFRVTVNTDNRLMSATTLTHEFALLCDAFDYSIEHVRAGSAAMRPRASLVRTRCADHWSTGSINSTEPRRRDTRVERMSFPRADRRGLAVRQWSAAHRPRLRFRVPPDVFSRYMRMTGHSVLMISGTDEHGTPILVQAERENLTPRPRTSTTGSSSMTCAGWGCRMTSSPARLPASLRGRPGRVPGLHKNGYVVPKTAMGAISPSTGRTLPDRYIEGTCPICGYPSARGDQCDNCGNQLDPVDLINPVSRINGETPKFVETEHFFLDLPALAGSLGKWLAGRTDWRPNVLKFSQNLLEDLRPRAITRDLDWGVPVPLDGWRDQPLKRLYVWFDAVIGYLSASVEWARRSGDPDAWREWWINPDARGYYFMGKDNIVFHSVIWPGILLGHNGEGDHGGTVGPRGELRLPDELVSSEYLTMSGSKFPPAAAG